MRVLRRVETLDYHTAGEPLRIVTSGLPDIPGGTMPEKRRYMATHLDDWRRFLMLEPRGHADMYGAVLTPPVSSGADTGVLFLHNEGYSTMCGHGIIALVHAAVEHGVFSFADASAIRIDTPAGQVVARANFDANGGVESVSFRNVPSFVLEPDLQVTVAGQRIGLSIAYGGAFYAYVDADAMGFSLEPAEAARLVELGRQIKEAVSASYSIRHPDGDEALNFLYGTIFTLPGPTRLETRNVCIFADGELDRSPTGTGVSGRAALHWARGELGPGEELVVESIIGTRFTVQCVGETRVGQYAAVIPEVSGSAWFTGAHRFSLDKGDPLARGFLLR